MVEHVRKVRVNKSEAEAKHSSRNNKPHQVPDQFQEIEQTVETPFRPRSEKHKVLLSSAQSSEQRANLLLHLQQTYGNSYVQRLIGTGSSSSDTLARPALDEEGNLTDRIRDQQPGRESRSTIKRTRDTDSDVSRPDDGGSESFWETEEESEVCYSPPDITAIAADSTVESERAADWAAGESDYAERFAWIMWNEYTDDFSVTGKVTGNEFGVNPTPKPADSPPLYRVGEYHQHPPLTPAMQADVDAGRASYPVGPSGQDESASQADDSPGLVRDFTDETRATVTDYEYGPSQRSF